MTEIYTIQKPLWFNKCIAVCGLIIVAACLWHIFYIINNPDRFQQYDGDTVPRYEETVA